ncbi:hypothetical protein O3P69_016749 [Scylla paramamosain]|uniref:Uncharacterized protein n=1 Tax=Scylla paramamosain TaxID=85552 RepID=A0AAW0SYY7_SCYPA
MMERTPCSVSVTKCNLKRQGSFKVDSETSYNKRIAWKEKSSRHAETEVMVERVSSTTEQSPLIAPRKASLLSKRASLDKIPMLQDQRNRKKHMHSKIHDNRDASKFKPAKSCCSSPSRRRDRDRDRDRKREKQHQETLSASKRASRSHPQSSMKKLIPRREKPVDPEISSSSLVLKSRESSLFSRAEIKPGSSTYAGKSSYSHSERDPKSHSKCEKYVQSSGHSNTSRNHAFQENSSQDASRQKHYWQDGEMGRREESLKENSILSESSKNRKSYPYKEMVENKIREIRNNIEKMSSKEMVEKKVKEIRSNLEKMSNDLPQSLIESLEAESESASEEKEGCDEESKEEESQLVPFLPSSRCCSPPPRPAVVEKYWSDADETEDESDSEKHLLHVNSVNIVLNYLKNNSEKYFVDGKEISNQITSYQPMNAKHKKSKGNIKERLSFPSDLKSHNTWSKSGHFRERSGGSAVQKNQSQSSIYPYGLGPLISKQQAKSRDSCSRPPSGDTDFFDRKSLHSPSHDRHHYRSLHSPLSLQEDFSTSRGSRSPTWCEDHEYRHSLSYKDRRGFQRDRESCSPSRHRRDRASCSPPRYTVSQSPSRHTRYRESCLPPRCRGSRSPSRHTKHTGSRSPSIHTGHIGSRSPLRHTGSRSPSRHTRHTGSCSPRCRVSRSPSIHTRHVGSHSLLRHRGSCSPSVHTRHIGSHSPLRYRGSRSPSIYTRLIGSHSPLRHRGSCSPSRHTRHVGSHSPFRCRVSHSPTRHIRSRSPLRHGASSYRESCPPSRYRGGFHRNRESSSPHYTEDPLSDRGSPSWTWDAEDSLANRRLISVLHEQYSIQKQGLSPESLQRYGIKHSHYSEDLRIEFMNPQKKSKTGSENYAAIRDSEGHCHSREQHSRPEMSLRDEILSRDRGTRLKEGGSSTSRTGHGSRASSQHTSPSHSDHHVSFRGRLTPSLESQGSVPHEGSVEALITRTIRQESGFERPTSHSKKKNISQRWQQVKREDELKLPLAFGKGAKKTLKIDESFNWDKDSLSADTRNNQRREDRRALEVNVFKTEDDADDDDDEPIIDRPEDYLNVSSTMTMYRPSFVPDTHDREKLAGLVKTNRLSQSHEDFSVAGPSGIISLPTPSGKEQDNSPYRLSGSECDRVIENIDSVVPQVSTSSVSLEPGPSGVTTSAKSDVFDLSSALKEVTAEAAKSEEEKAILTLNSAEMSTLLTLIKLAKNHVATGKDLPSNFSQVLQTGGGANNSETAEQQGKHSGENQQQPSISQVSANMQHKVMSENAKASASEGVDIGDIAESEKKGKATASESADMQEKVQSKNVRTTASEGDGMDGIVESEKNGKVTGERISMDGITESEKNGKATTEHASMHNVAVNEKNAKATISTDEGMDDKIKFIKYTKAAIFKSESKQDKAESEMNTKPTSSKSNTKNNKDINDGQNANHVASRKNKIDRISKDETDEIVLEKKKSDDHFSQSKAGSKHPQSRNKVQGSKTDSKLLKVRKNPKLSPGENVALETTLEKGKGKGQSPKKLKNVKKVSSIKKKKLQLDEKREFSKSGTKSSVIGRTFKLMQSVKVDLSASQETIASCKRAKHHQGITNLENPKKQLKQVDKRIFMDDSFSTEPKKDESSGAGKQPQEMHPLYQETSVPDHSLSVCLACKCNLKLDEFTTVSLNTGTVTLRCRNCHTCRIMENVLSLQCYSGTAKSKNVASKKSEALGPSVESNNSKNNKKVNVTASSEQRKYENKSKKDGSLQRTNSVQEARKKKEDPEQVVNNIKQKKGRTPACQKVTEEKVKLVDAQNASRTVLVFREDKCQSDRSDAEKSSSPNKGTHTRMSEKELAESASNDPSLCAFPWLSSTKVKGLFDNLELRENSPDEDRFIKKKQIEKSCERRKTYVPSAKRKHKHDKTTAHSSKSIKVVKSTTTTKVNDADSKMNGRKSDTPVARTTTKSVTATTLTQSSMSNATFKTTMHPEPNVTSELVTTLKTCLETIPNSETKSTPETKTSPETKPVTEIKATIQTRCGSLARSATHTEISMSSESSTSPTSDTEFYGF